MHVTVRVSIMLRDCVPVTLVLGLDEREYVDVGEGEGVRVGDRDSVAVWLVVGVGPEMDPLGWEMDDDGEPEGVTLPVAEEREHERVPVVEGRVGADGVRVGRGVRVGVGVMLRDAVALQLRVKLTEADAEPGVAVGVWVGREGV